MMYKCNDCDHVFMGSDFTTTCPECGSTNIEVVKKDGGLFGTIKEWILNNKPLASVICVILLLFLFRNCQDQPSSGITKDISIYKFVWKPMEDHIAVLLKDENGKIQPYSLSKFSWLELSASIIDDDGVEYLVSINKNKIFRCTKGTLTIKWKYDKKRLNSLDQAGYKTYDDDDLEGVATSNSNNCIPIIEVNSVESDVCSKTIFVKVNPKVLSSDILVSINGKNGDYSVKKSRSFPKEVSSFDVWIYHKDFPNYKYKYNGELPSIEESDGCVQDTEKIKNTIVSGINSSNYDIVDENIDWFTNDCVIVYNNEEIPVSMFVSETQTFSFQKSANNISISTSDIEISCCLISKINLN